MTLRDISVKDNQLVPKLERHACVTHLIQFSDKFDLLSIYFIYFIMSCKFVTNR